MGFSKISFAKDTGYFLVPYINVFLMEQKAKQVPSHYYGSLACEEPLQNMNIQFCLNRPCPLFQQG